MSKCILTRIPHHTLGVKKWSWDYLFSSVIVGSIKYSCETVLCEKMMNVLLARFSIYMYVDLLPLFRILFNLYKCNVNPG